MQLLGILTPIFFYLKYINKEHLPLNKVDKDFAKGFISFLKTCTYNNGKKKLSDTTQRIFVNRFGTIIKIKPRNNCSVKRKATRVS